MIDTVVDGVIILAAVEVIDNQQYANKAIRKEIVQESLVDLPFSLRSCVAFAALTPRTSTSCSISASLVSLSHLIK